MTTTQKRNTADLLLDTAQAMILQEGFRAVSVDRIIASARVSKGTFFYHFRSKEDLAVRMLKRFLKTRGQAMTDALEELRAKNDHPLDVMLGFIDALDDIFQTPGAQSGCLIGSFTYQLTEEIPELQQLAEASFQGWKQLLEPQFQAICDSKPQANSATAEQFVTFLFSLVQGAIITSRISGDDRALSKQLQEFKRYLTLNFQQPSDLIAQ